MAQPISIYKDMIHIKLFETEEKTYKWGELSDQAQEAALEKYRDINVEDGDWHDFIIEEWQERLEEMGFRKVEIQYSGFWSQGDGASFTGALLNSHLQKFLKEELKLEGYPQEVFDSLDMGVNRMSSHHYHENTVNPYVEWDSSEEVIVTYPFGFQAPMTWDLEEVCEEIHAKFEPWVRKTCREIYSALEKEYEDLCSDDSVADTILANDWDFDENGKKV